MTEPKLETNALFNRVIRSQFNSLAPGLLDCQSDVHWKLGEAIDSLSALPPPNYVDRALISVMQPNELLWESKEHRKIDNSEMLRIAGAHLKKKVLAVTIERPWSTWPASWDK